MLNFILWGIALNVYSYIVLCVIVKAIYPKGYKSPYDKPKPLMLKIATMFAPYLVFLLSLAVLVGFVACKFDYKEIEELRYKINEKT